MPRALRDLVLEYDALQVGYGNLRTYVTKYGFLKDLHEIREKMGPLNEEDDVVLLRNGEHEYFIYHPETGAWVSRMLLPFPLPGMKPQK